MIIYEGFFIKNKLTGTLDKDIEFKHITTEYRPAKTHEYLYGAIARFKVLGYGNDGKNEGYKVALLSVDTSDMTNSGKASEVYDLYKQIEIPHITLSISLDGKAVNTKYLDFNDTKMDDTIIAVFGGYDGTKPVLGAI